MTFEQKYKEAEELEERAKKLREEAHALHMEELRRKPLLDRLIFAARARCPCGAGLAYDPAEEGGDGLWHGPSAWDCSAIILGTAIHKGKPGAVEHTAKLPFVFYEIKSENQPSAFGATTRPS